jgi:hypothetical protein
MNSAGLISDASLVRAKNGWPGMISRVERMGRASGQPSLSSRTQCLGRWGAGSAESGIEAGQPADQ